MYVFESACTIGGIETVGAIVKSGMGMSAMMLVGVSGAIRIWSMVIVSRVSLKVSNVPSGSSQHRSDNTELWETRSYQSVSMVVVGGDAMVGINDRG